MTSKDTQELELEDILKEFSEPSLEEILREFGQEPPAQPEAPEPQATSDTVRLDRVEIGKKAAPVSQETAVFQQVPAEKKTAPKLKLPKMRKPKPAAPPKKKVEPFSDEWEPEYDEPMGEYIPAEPIVFRPNTRLRELRQKLVAGPERRYYDLAEKGMGHLRTGIILSLLVFLMSAAFAALFSMGIIIPDRLRLLVFGQLLSLLLSALLGCYRLMEGVKSMAKGRFTLNTLLVFTFFACLADGILSLRSQRVPSCIVFCLDMVVVQWSALQRRSAEMAQMDTLRKASDLTAVVKTEDYWQERPGYQTAPGDPDSFTQNYDRPSAPEKMLHIYAIISLVLGIAIGVLGYLQTGLEAGVQAAAAALVIAVPATAFISMSRPAAIVEKRLYRFGTVLCGWQGIKAVEHNAVCPLRYKDLFPDGAVKLNGVKFFGSAPPDQVVACAEAMVAADGGSLAPLIDKLLRRRGIQKTEPEELIDCQSGLSGVVDGLPVLVGTLEFMREMELEIPKEAQVAQAVYVAVDGELSGVFAVNYSRSKSAAAGLRTLCGSRSITPVLTDCDFMLTSRFIRGKLGVKPRNLELPERQTRQQLAQTEPAEDAQVVALMVKNTLASRAFALTGARALASSQRLGAWVHILAGAMGLAAVAVLTFVGAPQLLSPENLLLYSLVWTVPGLLITEWPRCI